MMASKLRESETAMPYLTSEFLNQQNYCNDYEVQTFQCYFFKNTFILPFPSYTVSLVSVSCRICTTVKI